MARPNTREDIIRAGLKCLVEKGFNAVGVQDITDAAGVPKGSFYNHFESKDALGLEVVERYGANQTQAGDSDRIRVWRHSSGCGVTSSGLPRCLWTRIFPTRNCILGGFSAELANQSETIREGLRKLYGQWTKDIEATIAEAQAKGEIANKTKAAEI